MNVGSHKMSLMAIMAAAQQQQPPATSSNTKTSGSTCGSISPKTPVAKVTVAVKRTRKRKRVVGSKKPRKSRVIYKFTAETLAQYFHLSQRDAAKLLGVAPITMKRNCKRQGILWPFRAQKIEAAYRARLGIEDSASDDDDLGRNEDDEEDLETQAAHALASMTGSATTAATLSEAGLVFARFPYLCLEEQHEATVIAL